MLRDTSHFRGDTPPDPLHNVYFYFIHCTIDIIPLAIISMIALASPQKVLSLILTLYMLTCTKDGSKQEEHRCTCANHDLSKACNYSDTLTKVRTSKTANNPVCSRRGRDVIIWPSAILEYAD